MKFARPKRRQPHWWFVIDTDGRLVLPCTTRAEARRLTGGCRRVAKVRLVVVAS